MQLQTFMYDLQEIKGDYLSVSYVKHACRFIVSFIYICDIIKTEINNYYCFWSSGSPVQIQD